MQAKCKKISIFSAVKEFRKKYLLIEKIYPKTQALFQIRLIINEITIDLYVKKQIRNAIPA